MPQYIALVGRAENHYVASFPDWPGCTATGKTADRTIRNAEVCLRDWMTQAQTEGSIRPVARSAATLMTDLDVADAVADGCVLVPVKADRLDLDPVAGPDRSKNLHSANRPWNT